MSVSLPDPLLEQIGHAADAAKTGRSAWIRAAINAKLAAKTATGHVHGSITIAYADGNEARISLIRHAFHDVVLSMMHTHCDPGQCMDVLLVGGEAKRIEALQHQLECDRAVARAQLVLIA